MHIQELYSEAEKQGVHINLNHINNWLQLYAGHQELSDYINHKRLPSDVSIQQIAESTDKFNHIWGLV